MVVKLSASKVTGAEYDPIRRLSGPGWEAPDFRWTKPLHTPIPTLSLVCPASFEHVAQIVLEPPGGEPYSTPRSNPWLRATLIQQEKSELPTPIKAKVNLLAGRWLCFGPMGVECGSLYRWVDSPKPDSPDRWAERDGTMNTVRRFAKIAEPLCDAVDPIAAYEAARDEAMAFAIEFGPLGYGGYVKLKRRDLPSAFGKHHLFYAEPLAYWLSESLLLGHALRLRNAIDKFGSNLKEIRRRLLGTRAQASLHLAPKIEKLLDPLSAKIYQWLLPENASVASHDVGGPNLTPDQAEFYRRHFEVCKELGVLGLVPDPRGLEYAGVRLQQREEMAALRTGPRPVVDPNSQASLLEDALAQAKVELVGILDSKLHENVMVRCFGVPGSTASQLPRNLIGALYLRLAQDIENPAARRAYCSYRECRRPLKGKERIRQDANYCNDTCKAKERNARRRDKNSAKPQPGP